MMYYWAIVIVFLVAMSWRAENWLEDAVPGAVFMGAATLIAGWYLYRKPNVVAYFEAIEDRAPRDSG